MGAQDVIQILIGGSTSVFLDESLPGKLFRLIIHPLYRLYIVEALSQTHSDKTLNGTKGRIPKK